MDQRRLRSSPHIRELTREHRVHREQLIQPLFVVEGLKDRETIPGLTDVYRDTSETLSRQVESDLEKGVSKFLLFGVPATKQVRDLVRESKEEAVIYDLKINVLEKDEAINRLNKIIKKLGAALDIIDDRHQEQKD